MDSLSKSLTLSIVFLLSIVGAAAAQKLTAEEILVKNLDSIGTKERRGEIKNQFAGGLSIFQSKLPSRQTAGKVAIASDPENLFFISSFNSQEYPFEKIGYFKDKVSLPFVTSGTRSPLGAFIADHTNILSDALLTGSISVRWFAPNSQTRKGKLDFDGTKKIDGRKTYALGYLSKIAASPDFTVKMFFDVETFQHVRTEYRRTVAPKDQPFGTLGVQGGVVIALTENFGDFKTTGNLTLPHSYKLSYITESNSGVYEYEWNFTIAQYLFNQNLAADFFTFEKK
jgi:hypothetical protein